MEFETIKARFDHYVEEYNRGKGQMFNPLLKGALLGVLTLASGGTPEKRHVVQKALTGKNSSKTLTEAEWYAFGKMVDPHYDEEGKAWKGKENLFEICKVVLDHAREVVHG